MRTNTYNFKMKYIFPVIFVLICFFCSILLAEPPEGIFKFPFPEIESLSNIKVGVSSEAMMKKKFPTTCRPIVYNDVSKKLFNRSEFNLVPSKTTDSNRFTTLAENNLKLTRNGFTWVFCSDKKAKIKEVAANAALLRRKIEENFKRKFVMELKAAFNFNGTVEPQVFLIEVALSGSANMYPSVLALDQNGHLKVLEQPTNTD